MTMEQLAMRHAIPVAVGDVLITGIIIYHYGFIMGKRADCARRKYGKK